MFFKNIFDVDFSRKSWHVGRRAQTIDDKLESSVYRGNGYYVTDAEPVISANAT